MLVEQTYLILADGTSYPGYGVGAPVPTIPQMLGMDITRIPCGEVVFNTTMGAYQEILTDPSYAGQMVAMTCVHIGNYGTDPAWNEMSSIAPACRALIVRDLYDGPVPPLRMPLLQMLETWGMSAITGVDTRSLTIHLREHGSCYGVLVRSPSLTKEDIGKVVAYLNSCPQLGDRDLIGTVTSDCEQDFEPDHPNGHRFALIDFGIKRSIVKALLDRGVGIALLPARVTAQTILALDPPVDAVFLSNGPGDPATLTDAIGTIKELTTHLPVLGICLGHQLIAHALGGHTVKMKFGHHGGNHPVCDTVTGQVFVTAQNHGYCVDAQSLPPGIQVTYINANDGTIEGLVDPIARVMSVQFHPEAAPGPRDARKLFNQFIAFVENTVN